MNDDTFAKLVAEDVKNKVTPSSRKLLMQRENWDRWERALIALVENLNDQLANIDADSEADRERYSGMEDGHVMLSEAMAAYESRKKKIERFRFHVESKLTDVSKMITTGTPIEDEIMGKMVLLTNAIKKHRELLNDYTIEATPIDRALWDALDGEWTFDSIREEDLVDLPQ